MRAKYVLTALALPALFAACTNDDFEQIQNPGVNNSVLQGRAKGHITLTATKGEESAETRVVGNLEGENTLRWMWEGANDKLGATVVDYAAGGGIVDKEQYPAYAITNYPFAPNIDEPAYGAEFSTPGAVVSGAYMFYNKYDGKNTARRVIGHEINRLIKVNAGKEAGLKQVGTDDNGGQNFFISPIVDLAIADGSDIAKPISLSSVYSIFHIQLTTDLESKYYAGEGFKVNKVVLETMTEDDKFMRKLVLNPASIANVQKTLAKANPGLFKTNGAIDAMNLNDEEIGKALSLVNEKLADPKTVIGTSDNGTDDLVYQLEEAYKFTGKDQTMDLLVIVPAGVYNQASNLAPYSGKTAGVFKMTVYTSEGTYTDYIGDNKTLTLKRGYKYPVKREMIIDGGRTNINLFDPNEGFNVETTEDYNYAIEYIKDHYRDFGNSSDWKTPVLNFVDGKTIKVDAEHYFPEFPVKYNGNATLQLVCEKHAYTFNPENVILGTSKKRPTIKVVSETSSIKFEESVQNVAGKKDGENITAAVKLISAGNVEIAEGKTVNFELLTSDKQLDIEKGATVNVSGVTTTDGIVNVKESSKLNANNTFTNSAEVTIEAKAVATLKKAATNDGTITVEGLGALNAEAAFTNKFGGEIVVENCDLQYMNSKDRAKATFTTVSNAGTITVLASVDKKGTYGGLVEVSTSLTNTGKIFNNGEMKIASVTNSGTITLQEDPYALLAINGGSLTDNKGNGSVVLADATQYEMFDSYYTGRNDLNAVKNKPNVIEATLTQEAYSKVIENYNTYGSGSNAQETAWGILNKVTISGEVKLGATLTDGKNFVLPDNAKLNAQAALTIDTLIVIGKGAVVTAKTAGTKINADMVNVKAGAEAEVEANAAVMFAVSANTVLNVDGKLVNKGSLDTEASGTTQANNIMTVIGAKGELVNEGKMSQAATRQYPETAENFKTVKDFIGKYGKNLKGSQNYRIEVSSSTNLNKWSGDLTVTETITKAIFKAILSRGTWKNVGSDYYGLEYVAGKGTNAKTYALYADTEKSSEMNEVLKAAVAEAKKNATAPERTMFDQILENLTEEKAFDFYAQTWFKITNDGTLDLLKAADNKNVWAWGESVNGPKATKKGKFNNEM